MLTDLRLFRDGEDVTIGEARNPVTRTWVTLSPRVPVAEMDEFKKRFAAFCVAGWNLGHLDPQWIDAPFGWLEHHHLPSSEDPQ
jgi:hypothetical protein